MVDIDAKVTLYQDAFPDAADNRLIKFSCPRWADNDRLVFRNAKSVWIISAYTDKGTEAVFDARTVDIPGDKTSYTFNGAPATGVTKLEGLAWINYEFAG